MSDQTANGAQGVREMRVESSLAEMLMNAIAAGRVWGVQFSRKHGKDPGDERRTFEDLNKVIEKRIDSALEVARENGHQKAEQRGELKGLKWVQSRHHSSFTFPLRRVLTARIAELKKELTDGE